MNRKLHFPFPNEDSRNDDAIKAAFQTHGFTVEDISRESFGMWTWVLLSNGELWLLDKSHGCGGVFNFYKG